ncbi:hypothetical protein P154DRAFT_421080 [Amniculicola lignicola CBS 123094]|uniref:Core domain-containing protein n=1 Tax=Amniculicola lignicola CBS 123094 TaxID=1392246 RepID=A0A6A5WYI7_9PLEO|nr:hypothetical protein P154DRAFT_421080 [Amniculicola lignicola CBS 123094]
MASPYTMCASCLRVAQRPMSRTILNPPRVLCTSRTFRTTPATVHRTMYLDFLAPSTLKKPSKSLPQLNFHRPMATATTASSDARQARAIINPRTTEDGNPMVISLSPRAAHRLSSIAAKDDNPNSALRISIESGGCHGFQYLMDLTDLTKTPPAEDDTVFEGENGAKVVVDESSLELLNGSTVDYTMELIGSQFKVTGIPGATSSCGCGTSFDIQL